ncbi:MAG: cyclic nucleotide-binding domain-containing protein [Nitrospirae bacterium]|nr:MAG: cyclic nucleotide-binding domain-containing protein [Nitrospirota bacterium]
MGTYNIKTFYKGQLICKEGQTGETAFLVKSGAVTIYKTVNNNQVTLAHIKPGQVFGEMGVLSGEPRNASAVADDFCEIIIIDKDVLEQHLRESPKIIQAITKSAIDRLHKTNKKISEQPAGNVFMSVCSIIEFMYLSNNKQGDDTGIPYHEVSQRIREILSIPQLEIDTIIKKLTSINILDVLEKKIGSEVVKSLKMPDSKTFLKKAKQFYDEYRDTLQYAAQEREFIDIHEFADIVNTTPELIYKKIGTGEIPDNIFFIHKRAAVDWSREVGEGFFKKVKRRSLNIEDLSEVDDIVYVDGNTLQEAFSRLGHYKMGILAFIAGEEAKAKIYANLSSKIAGVVKEQVSARQEVDEIEAGDIEKELILLIKSLKGVK